MFYALPIFTFHIKPITCCLLIATRRSLLPPITYLSSRQGGAPTYSINQLTIQLINYSTNYTFNILPSTSHISHSTFHIPHLTAVYSSNFFPSKYFARAIVPMNDRKTHASEISIRNPLSSFIARRAHIPTTKIPIISIATILSANVGPSATLKRQGKQSATRIIIKMSIVLC